MIHKTNAYFKGILLQTVESYYDNGVSRQRVIEKIEYSDQLYTYTIYDDPISQKEKAIADWHTLKQ